MDDWELQRRENFQREQREAREKAARDRQAQRQRWQERREVAKVDRKNDGIALSNEASMDRLFVEAELSVQALKHEFLFGEWSKQGDHMRELELALVELNRMEHSTNLQMKLEDNRHSNAKDYKSHETDELIRLKRAFGELTAEDREKFFTEFKTESDLGRDK